MPQFKTYWLDYQDHQWGVTPVIQEAQDWDDAQECYPGAVCILNVDPTGQDRDILHVTEEPDILIELLPNDTRLVIHNGDQAVSIPLDAASALSRDLLRAKIYTRALAEAHLWPQKGLKVY